MYPFFDNDDDDTDINDVFPVKITAATLISSQWYYDWIEQSFDPDTGDPIDAPGGRSGDAVDGPFLVELTGTDPRGEPSFPFFDAPFHAWGRLRGIVNGAPFYECVTSRESDATLFTNGIVNTSTQSMSGWKKFSGGLTIDNSITDPSTATAFGTDVGIMMSDINNGGLASPVGAMSWYGGTGIGGFGNPPADEFINLQIARVNYNLTPAYPTTGLLIQDATITAEFTDQNGSAAQGKFAVTTASGVKVGATGTVGGLVFSGGLYVSGSISFPAVAYNTITGIPDAIDAIDGLVPAANKLAYYTGSSSASLTDLTSFARTILDDTSDSDTRTTLGLGTMATQDASAVSITGGTITGGTITGGTW